MQQALHTRTGDLAGGAGTADLLAGLRRHGAGILAWLTARPAQPFMADELSPAQRKDIGIVESPDQAHGPILEVDGALMRRLMSLR
jgi:hypothetical protein